MYKNRASERASKWQKENRDRYNENQAAWRARNRDKTRASVRNWYYRRTPEEKEKHRLYQQAWRASNPEKYQRYMREFVLRQYGLTPESFDAMLFAQDGRCAMQDCRTDDPGKRGWQVDHDHGSGAVRGILCFRCNLALGHFESTQKRGDVFRSYLAKKEN